MKTIIVRWVPELRWGYGLENVNAMLVIESDHPRFVKGSRFYFGFMKIATNDGYTIISLPLDKTDKTTPI
jgi:hypothetical protein